MNARRRHECVATLVIGAFDEPTGIRFLVDAVEAVDQRDVPFVAIPGSLSPPIARGSPGAGGVENFPVDAGSADAYGAILFEFDFRL